MIFHACGSFQLTSYYASDGIYATDDKVQQNNNTQRVGPVKQLEQNINKGNTSYSQYFNEKSKEYYWDDSSEDLYFTDVNNYSGNQSLQGQWGSAPQKTNIYIIGSPIDYSLGYLGFDPYFYDGFGFGNFGRGFYGNNSFRYNRFGWGGYNPYFTPLAYGFYNPYNLGFSPYYRFNGYNSYFGYNQYDRHNRNYNSVARNRGQNTRRAYSRSRRGTSINRDTDNRISSEELMTKVKTSPTSSRRRANNNSNNYKHNSGSNRSSSEFSSRNSSYSRNNSSLKNNSNNIRSNTRSISRSSSSPRSSSRSSRSKRRN
tara:strand:- start:828 stop:1769 length:942 start_codon:yes stop_codon:yes gene_type:complete